MRPISRREIDVELQQLMLKRKGHHPTGIKKARRLADGQNIGTLKGLEEFYVSL